MKIATIENKDKEIVFVYRKISLNEIILSFRQLVSVFLSVYQSQGTDQLQSYTFTPYGNKPFIRDISL